MKKYFTNNISILGDWILEHEHQKKKTVYCILRTRRVLLQKPLEYRVPYEFFAFR